MFDNLSLIPYELCSYRQAEVDNNRIYLHTDCLELICEQTLCTLKIPRINPEEMAEKRKIVERRKRCNHAG